MSGETARVPFPGILRRKLWIFAFSTNSEHAIARLY